jgi:hypothetical protein
MSDEIVPDWPRPSFEPSGRAAELMYLIVGPPPAGGLQISRKRHHVDRLEPALQISTHRRADDPAWFEGWFAPPLGGEIDMLFADPEAIRSADQLSVVRGTFGDPADLNYLRNTIGVVSAIAEAGAEAGAGAILDVNALAWWRPGDWRRQFVDGPSQFRIGDHVGVVVTDDPRHHPGLRTHTRGMKKFGRPELQIRHLPGEYSTRNPAVRNSGDILNGIASYLAQGAVIRDGQTMHLPNLDATVTFVETPDDSDTTRHFHNSALEICDFDPAQVEPQSGAPRLLEQAARNRDTL